MQAVSALCLGASGYLSSEGNIAPHLCTGLIQCFASGDLAGAAAAYGRIIRLFSILTEYGGTRATKAALGVLGLPGGITRRPRLPLLDPAEVAQIASALDDLDIRSVEHLDDPP
jgi:4-hydroxy-tetrahydrodipicolinate synthase